MKRIRENRFFNQAVTITALLIIVASPVSVFVVEGINWAEASIGITAGTSLLFLRKKRK